MAWKEPKREAEMEKYTRYKHVATTMMEVVRVPEEVEREHV